MFRSVCVFCGSSRGSGEGYAQAAEGIGRLLAGRGMELVYGGSRLGLMGILADACLAAGGRVVGVMPRALIEKEIAHTGISELHSVDSMHARKALMADKAEAFIALPGGYGTWEEFCEVLTWSQLGLQRKPCGVLNVNGYYEPLLAMADRAVEEGFLRREHRALLVSERDPEELLKRLESVRVPLVEKWMDRRNR
jgi:uncharacterized protein (TIGR00730 family)